MKQPRVQRYDGGVPRSQSSRRELSSFTDRASFPSK